MATVAEPRVPANSPGGLAGLTPSGRGIVPVSWALYDFANTIFSYAVVSVAIGLWLTDESRFGAGPGQLAQGIAIAISVGINALVSPILGALSDRGGRRLPFLLFFTVLCIGPTLIIGLSPALLGVLLFIVANFAYQAALIYYDATLAVVSYPASRGRLSGIGVAIGYMGTIFVALVLIVLGVEANGMFIVAGLLFAIFAAPIFLVVREPATGAPPITRADVFRALGQLRETIEHARAVPGLGRFLVGRFFYSDAVNTLIVVMSVIAVRAMGLTESEFLMLSLMLTVIAILTSFFWGWLTDRIGPKRSLLIVLASWSVGLFMGIVALGIPGTTPGIVIFVAAGAILGSGLGGVQVTDRVLMIRLSPASRLGEFFGIYGLVGKASQVVGSLIYGLIVFFLVDPLGNGAYQIAVLSLFGTMLIGLWLVWPVRDDLPGVGGATALPVTGSPLALASDVVPTVAAPPVAAPSDQAESP
ncbi:MAG: MFS transporter [Chloroflexota bacterium]|nr:MFS transporter [Chloroflexota bacterium]MDH5244444.1 MFS transporter [Chloroflexota bacterium]